MAPTLRTAALALTLSLRALAAPDAGPAAPADDGLTPHQRQLQMSPPPPGSVDQLAAALALDGLRLGDAIPLAGAEVAPIHTPSAPEAWGGIQDPGAAELSQRVASYDLHALLDPKAHTVEGSETLRWKNRSALPIRTLYFHLYLNAFEGPHSTWMTEKAGLGAFRSAVETKKGEWGWIDVAEVTQGGKPAAMSFVHPDNGPETDRSVLKVVLPEAIAPGATGEVQLKFHDQLPRVIARTGWFDTYHLVAQWFPKVGVLELPGERGATAPRWNVHEFHLNTEFYADFGSYDLEITAPKGFTVAATGERVGEPRETEAGVVHKFHQDDVHDAVFTAYDKYAAPLKGTYQGPGSPTVTVETYFPSEFAASAAASHQAALDSLKYFSDTLGPYPYRHLTVIVPPHNAAESGGMEYETFFTSEGGNGLLGGVARFVSVHEFGHGYFMGLLASNEFEEPYLDEGMNELWDDRMLDGEAIHLDFGLAGRLGFSPPDVTYWDQERIARGNVLFAPDPVVATSWSRFSNGSYASVYPKTAILFHDLEVQLGGDLFARGMKLYYQRWHHRHPSTADLLAALSDACEKPADKALVQRWFDDEIYGVVPVDDRVTDVSASEVVPLPRTELKDGKRVELDEEEVDKQIAETRKAFAAAEADAGVGDAGSAAPDAGAIAKDEAADGGAPHKPFHPGPFPFRSVVQARRRAGQLQQTLLVKFEDGTSQTLSWPPGESWHKWIFEGPARVESAQLDPEAKLLLDQGKLDDGRTREAKSLPGRRWTLEIASWLELFFSLVGAL